MIRGYANGRNISYDRLHMRKMSFVLFLAALLLLIATFVRSPQTSTNPSTTISPTAFPMVNQTVLGKTTKTAGCITVNGLPDNACTPGEADARVTEDNIHTTICISGYSSSVRPPVSVTNTIKTERMQAYGDTDSKANYELDHLISLELGGCPDCIANLWPEPYNEQLGAREKDTVDNYLHKQVCNGAMTLHDAQEEIANNWVEVFMSMPKN